MGNDVRKPPIGAVLRLHQQGVRGWCGWCGLAVEEKTEVRGWLKWWHDACAFEMGIIENPGRARDAVFARDKGICCDCGEDWSDQYKLVPEFYIGERWVDGTRDEDKTLGPDGIRFVQISFVSWRNGYTWGLGPKEDRFPFVHLKAISLWHVDHKVPLWKVRHMPDLQRLEYFKLANLITRCHRCHEFKTTEEAADRAKIRRAVEAPPEKPKSKWASRKLVGRGFPPKGSRPMRRK